MLERDRGEAYPAQPFDELIGELPCYQEHWSLRAKGHLQDRSYGWLSVPACQLPLATHEGTCTRVQAELYILAPDNTPAAAFWKPGAATAPIGTVDLRGWSGMKQVEVGVANADFYPADHLLYLRECELMAQFRHCRLDEDPAYAAAWQAMHDFLLRRFPATQYLVATAEDPFAEKDQFDDFLSYENFLRQRGYVELYRWMYGKERA